MSALSQTHSHHDLDAIDDDDDDEDDDDDDDDDESDWRDGALTENVNHSGSKSYKIDRLNSST